MFTDNLHGVTGMIRLRVFHWFRLWRRYERWLDGLMAAWLQYRPGVFLDVGAHVGEILHKVKSLHPETPCIGFEPHPESWCAAQRLVSWSRLPDCQVLPIGLSNAPAVRRLYAREAATDSAASLVTGFRDATFYSRAQWVVVLDGDTVLRELQIGSVSLIKVDVEGGELEVLDGFGGTLESDRPAVICEVLPVYDTEENVGRLRKARQEGLQELLSRSRYRLARIQHDGTLDLLDELEVHSDLSRCEYFFVPQEEEDFLERFEATP